MKTRSHFNRNQLATSIGILLGTLVIAPVALGQEDSTSDTEVIEVRGLRGSLQESMSVKRDSKGVVDAISAEDIGKFPDTNLAESLQRISGVSISRNNGEGSEVTVRGFGADKNMITLNGRMMPSANAFADQQGTDRAFDFANLASESIRAVEVYKTGKANISTGGIGATINIMTAKPLNGQSGFKASVGGKAAHDTTNRVGSDITPELSGIFSYANDDQTWGVGLTISHQQRDSGSTSATVNDWRTFAWTPDDFSNIPIADGPNGESSIEYKNSQITNAPAPGQLFSLPNDIRYHYSDFERTRDNAQLTFQFAPNDDLIATVDYTFARNDILEQRGNITHWSIRNFDNVTFDTDQPVATSIIINESTGGTKDNGFGQYVRKQINTLNSIGVNLEYFVNDEFSLRFDAHSSEMDSSPDAGGIGASEIAPGFAAPINLTQRYDFGHSLPKYTQTIDDSVKPANANGITDAQDIGSNYLFIRFSDQVTNIEQFKLDGSYELDEGQFDFGVESRSMEMRQRFSSNQLLQGDWGIANPGEVPDGLFTEFNVVGEFNDFDTNGIDMAGFKGDAEALARWGAEAYGHDYALSDTLNEDHTVEEDTLSLYFQYSLNTEIGGMETNVLTGVRYESTDVRSISVQNVPAENTWLDNNDFLLVNGTEASNVSESHNYNHILPSLDIDLAITDELKARFSFGQTIARANYGDLRAAVTGIGTDAPTITGGTPQASASNPGLVPLLSTNFDFSVEYYFDDASYASIGFFDKRVSNFIGNSQETQNLFNLRDVTNGPRAQAAVQALTDLGFAIEETSLFVMTAVLDNPQDFPNGAADYDPSTGFAIDIATAYDISPNSTDPETEFLVQRPVNNKDANIYGFELAGQHFFGDTGFGIAANYTIVRGDVKFDDTGSPSVSQFALTGLSDSANFVLMYENYDVQARLAYNWRDEFLAGTSRGSSRSPTYVEAFSQIDFSVVYAVNDQLSVSVEGLNITGEDSRTHGRSINQMWDLFDLGARYQLGARYTF